MRRAVLIAIIGLFIPACSNDGGRFVALNAPACTPPGNGMILLAQTVQEATQLPCIALLPAGWSYAGQDFRNGSGTYWLSSAIAGDQAVQVQLLPSCDPTGTAFTAEGAPGVSGYASSVAGGEIRSFVFDGGCVVQRIELGSAADEPLIAQARETLGFVDRSALAAELQRVYGITLCGAGAEPCAG